MQTVRSFSRSLFVLLLVASIGAASLAACTGEPQSEDTQMACCKAMGKDCPMHQTAADCCKAEKNSHQGGALTAAVESIKLSVELASTAFAFAPIAPSVVDPFQRLAMPAAFDRHQPHSPPPHLRNIPLLI